LDDLAKRPAKEPRPSPGDAWFRAHFDGKVVAELRWLGNQYEIHILRMPARQEMSHACCTEKFEFAKTRADRLVREAFPHTCDKSECAPWMKYSAGGSA
jgi:hypothetical protein